METVIKYNELTLFEKLTLFPQYLYTRKSTPDQSNTILRSQNTDDLIKNSRYSRHLWLDCLEVAMRLRITPSTSRTARCEHIRGSRLCIKCSMFTSLKVVTVFCYIAAGARIVTSETSRWPDFGSTDI